MVEPLLLIAALLVSVVLHELSHGVVALWLGDPTAKAAGRLTLNPVKHLDPVGSFILPALLAFAGGPVFGYAKPVPVTPRNLRGTDRTGFAIVALAGPVSNVVIASVCVILLSTMYGVRLGELMDLFPADVAPEQRLFALRQLIADRAPFGARALFLAVEINLILAAFNLLPLPPLDGSRLLRPFLSTRGRQRLDQVEPYGFLILLLLLVFLAEPLFRVVMLIMRGLLFLIPI